MSIHWNSLIKRIESEVTRVLRGSKNDGVAVLTFTVIVGSDYKPHIWLMRGCDKVEPAARAAEFVKMARESDGRILEVLGQ